jgi:hypothetical protein
MSLSRILVCATSPIEFWSALACLRGHEDIQPIFVTDLQTIYSDDALSDCRTIAGLFFPSAIFVALPFTITTTTKYCAKLFEIDHHIAALASALEASTDTPLHLLSKTCGTVYFSCFTHQYVRCLLSLFPSAKRVLYPHGLDCPRNTMLLTTPWLYNKRSILNWLYSLSAIAFSSRSKRKRSAFINRSELLLALLKLVSGQPRLSVPYAGTDSILTFRLIDSKKYAVPLKHVPSIEDTLRVIVCSAPFSCAFQAWRDSLQGPTVMLLLSEYDRQPIQQYNSAWVNCMEALATKVINKTGASHLTIKSHPRSTTQAADMLVRHLRRKLPTLSISILSPKLSILPIEAFALESRVRAACSLGSASLPNDIGMPLLHHYTSPLAADLFDKSWLGTPFGFKFGPFLRQEIIGGRFLDLDSD